MTSHYEGKRGEDLEGKSIEPLKLLTTSSPGSQQNRFGLCPHSQSRKKSSVSTFARTTSFTQPHPSKELQ
eukprot:1998571-Amphidinium_carterae.2